MKICFWGNIAYALNGKTDGGGELQLALLAKSLARGGQEVVVFDINTKEDFITADGIKVLKIKGWDRKGVPIIRAFQRLLQLYKSLKAQNADIYYCRIRDFKHIIAFWAARKVKGKFILGTASDLDVANIMIRFKYFHCVYYGGGWTLYNIILNEIAFPWLIKNADMVLVQHEGQKNILIKKGIKSVVFPNLFDCKSIPVEQNDSPKNFIYVGSLNKRKGFHEFYEVVTKAPLHTFTVIGQPKDKLAKMYYEKLKSVHNISLLGRLSHSETLKHIAHSKAMISTSPMEGFPNVFIEAWACGVPVLSMYVDPGDIIKREELGDIAHGNIDQLLQSMDNFKITDKFVKKAKSYVEDNHALNANRIREINSLFYKLASRK